MNLDYSIVIPLYNHQNYIEQAILSCVNQTLPPRKIIVIDDGSKDNSLCVAQELAKKYNSIEVSTRENRGAHNTINEGLDKVRTSFVAILNSDDTYSLDRFEVLCRHMQKTPSCDLVFSGLSFIDENSREIPHLLWYENGLQFFKKTQTLSLALIHANFAMTTSNFFFKTDIVRELGGFADYRYAHDLEFLLRLIAKNKKIDFVEKKLIFYRMHPQNTIRESQIKVWQEISKIQRNFIYSAKSNPIFILKTLKNAFCQGYLKIFLKTILHLKN